VSDMITIANSQVAAENHLISKANRALFSDGSPLASCVWSLRCFTEIEPALSQLARSHNYDLYLLTDIDLPRKEDGLRDSSHLRHWLHEEFILHLHSDGCQFSVVRGSGRDRLEIALTAVDRLLASSSQLEASLRRPT
jgi:nicotinamide riboside kinase